MPKKQQKSVNTQPTSQDFLEISEIRNGIILLKDNSYRLILRTTNVNFSLKSEVEQNAMIFAYRNFLNSLTFPVQVLIRSRELDIDFYINKLKNYLDKQDNELLRLQTEEYIEYIKRLVEVANILDKQFYVIIPYTPLEDKTKSFLSFFQRKGKIKKVEFENAKSQLLQRADLIISQLSGIGIKSSQLTTREIAQLFYDIYNPSTAMGEKMEQNIEPYVTPLYVTQGTKAEQEQDLDEEIKK